MKIQNLKKAFLFTSRTEFLSTYFKLILSRDRVSIFILRNTEKDTFNKLKTGNLLFDV